MNQLTSIVRRVALPALAVVTLSWSVSGCAMFAPKQTADPEIAELRTQMTEMQKTIADVSLRLEELNNSVFVLQEATKHNRDDLKNLKASVTEPTVYISQAPAMPAGMASNVTPLPQGGENGRFDSASNGATPGAAGSNIGSSYAPAGLAVPTALPAPGEESSGDRDLTGAIGHYQQKHYGLAAYELAAFLAKNPASPQTAKARYYLAESYFQLGDHAQAAREFGLVLSGPSPYAAKATLRSAQCFLAMGQGEKAKALLKKVVALYSDTQEARIAATELDKL